MSALNHKMDDDEGGFNLAAPSRSGLVGLGGNSSLNKTSAPANGRLASLFQQVFYIQSFLIIIYHNT